jgi:hypothetical protein
MRGNVRGTVVGLVVAAGATWAHQWAGGGYAAVEPTLLVLLLASLAGGHAVARRARPGLPTLLVLAGLAQAAWHVALPAPAHAMHGPSGASMLLGHLLVVLVTVAVAAGADRALVALARDALALPPLPADVPTTRPDRDAPTPLAVLIARPVAPRGARGPPSDVA